MRTVIGLAVLFVLAACAAIPPADPSAHVIGPSTHVSTPSVALKSR